MTSWTQQTHITKWCWGQKFNVLIQGGKIQSRVTYFLLQPAWGAVKQLLKRFPDVPHITLNFPWLRCLVYAFQSWSALLILFEKNNGRKQPCCTDTLVTLFEMKNGRKQPCNTNSLAILSIWTLWDVFLFVICIVFFKLHCCFESGFYKIAQTSLQISVLLPQPSECYDYRHMLTYLAWNVMSLIVWNHG